MKKIALHTLSVMLGTLSAVYTLSIAPHIGEGGGIFFSGLEKTMGRRGGIRILSGWGKFVLNFLGALTVVFIKE